MLGSLVQHRFIVAQLDDLQAREGGPDHLWRVKVRQHGWPAGLVFQLPGGVALQHQHPAGLECSHHIGEQAFAHGGVGKLHKDGRHGVISGSGPGPLVAIGHAVVHRNLGVCRQLPGLGYAHVRDVKGIHLQALACQPDAVAPVTIGHAQHAATGGEVVGLRAQVVVGFLAKKMVLGGVALVPGGCGVGEGRCGHGGCLVQ